MNLYIVKSELLGKSWALRAKSTEDATGKVLSFSREYIERLDSTHPDQDLELDIRVSHIAAGITEL